MRLSRESKDEIDPYYLFMIAFSQALFSSGYPVAEVLVRLGSQQYFSPYHRYYKRISNLVNGFGYKISVAIGAILNQVSIKPFKDYLVRLSQAISYGDDLVVFLGRELKTAMAFFEAVNSRKQESMNTFLALYGTLNSALVFLIVDITVLAVLYGIGVSLIVLLSVAVAMISLMMTLVVYALYKPYARLIFPRHAYLTSSVVGIVGLALVFLGRNLPYIVGAGALMLGMGIYYRAIERSIEKIEGDYLVFVRYFSRTFDVVSNVPESLLGVLRGELGAVRGLVKKMYNRILLGVDKRIVFETMSVESRSHTVSMSNAVVSSTLEAGGNLGSIGESLAQLLEMLFNIKKRREQNGRTFETTVYTLQLTSSAVGGALLAIVSIFSKLFQAIAAYNVFSIGNVNIQEVSFVVLMVLLLLCFTNGFTIAVAYGKPTPLAVYYIGILLILTVVSYDATLTLTRNLFSSLFSPGGIIQSPPSS
ncbi:MAG: flagellar protein FlaJ [Thermoprotei archaeon]